MRVRILFSQSGSPTSGSEDISLVIVIVIISVGVIIILGIVLILVLGLVYHKKRTRINKPSCSNTCSPTGKPQGSHLIGNDLYRSQVSPFPTRHPPFVPKLTTMPLNLPLNQSICPSQTWVGINARPLTIRTASPPRVCRNISLLLTLNSRTLLCPALSNHGHALQE